MYKVLWPTNTPISENFKSSAALHNFLPRRSWAPRPIGQNLTGRQKYSTNPLRSQRRGGVPCPEFLGKVSSRVNFRGLRRFRKLVPTVSFGVRVDVRLEARLVGAVHPRVAWERLKRATHMRTRHMVPTKTQKCDFGTSTPHLHAGVRHR